MRDIAIFISGTGSNMEAIIKEIEGGVLKNLYNISTILTDRDKIKGITRGKALGYSVKVIDYKKFKTREDHEIEIIKFLDNFSIDLIVLAGYKRVLTKYFIDKFRGKIVNIHPADTKLYQGLNGYSWAFKNGLKTTKITVHYVDEGVDTGKIIAQKEIDISNCKNLEEIERIGLKEEHNFYPKVLKSISFL